MPDSQESVLNPTVVRLGLVSFFADISTEMLYPITPLFLTNVLGASMASVGLIEGFAEATASLLKLVSGAWSDRTGKRKIFVVAGYTIAALAKPITGLANVWPVVLGARALDRVGKGLRTSPRDALLAEVVSEKNRGRALGWHRAMDTTGAAIGPLVALCYLHFEPTALRSVYYYALVPGLLAALIALSVKEKGAKPKQAAPILPKWSETPSAFRRYLLVWGIFSIANSSDAFLLLRANNAGFSLVGTVLLYTIYNVVYGALSPYLGGLSDQWGRKKVLALGLGVFALVYGGFAFANAKWEFWGLYAVYGVYMAATDGVGKALCVDLVPKERKATALGWFGMVTGFCALGASVAAGLLWDHAGQSAPFLLGAAGAVAAAALLPLVPAKNQ
jgi:MFS family permease